VRARSTGCLFLVLGLLLPSVVYAEPPINVQVEVEFLLGYVEGSGCEFYRNGTWHDPKAAQAHLRDKYGYLAARNLINTTEDFIEKVATQSSLSGQPYKVRCRDGATVTANQWLRAELARFREFNRRPTSSLSDQGRKTAFFGTVLLALAARRSRPNPAPARCVLPGTQAGRWPWCDSTQTGGTRSPKLIDSFSVRRAGRFPAYIFPSGAGHDREQGPNKGPR